jgi:putative Mg2+ transporter-C (MgtC) family protein
MLNDVFDIEDVYKALYSILSGVILGLERELKDKKAGLRTISIICLGATLFAIISQKVGGTNNAGQIAAYIVSGVGFIGAGAIFKDGLTITGLTTAGIIWLAAAIGTSIGFGEYYMAGTFLIASFFAVILIPQSVGYFTKKKDVKQLEVVFKVTDWATIVAFENSVLKPDYWLDRKRIHYIDDTCEIYYDIKFHEEDTTKIYDALHNNPYIKSFEF